jgi:hypothetical protein
VIPYFVNRFVCEQRKKNCLKIYEKILSQIRISKISCNFSFNRGITEFDKTIIHSSLFKRWKETINITQKTPQTDRRQLPGKEVTLPIQILNIFRIEAKLESTFRKL